MQVELFATLRWMTRTSVVPDMRAATVGELVGELAQRFGTDFRKALLDAEGRLNPGVIVLVNGQNVHFLQQLDTPLSDQDTVAIFPPLGGG